MGKRNKKGNKSAATAAVPATTAATAAATTAVVPTPAPTTATEPPTTAVEPTEPTLKPASLPMGASPAMDIKDAMNMGPPEPEPEPPVTIPRKFRDSAKIATTAPTPTTTTGDTDIENQEIEKVKDTPIAKAPISPPTEASSSKPSDTAAANATTALQNIHSDTEDVKLPESVAHGQTGSLSGSGRKSQLGNYEDGVNVATTSAVKRPSGDETAERLPAVQGTAGGKGAEGKEGGFKGWWNRVVAALK
ncbi:hypothetical protein AA313_de0209367 [Arthrobotrys entomopaga]|nr:hypothetical protein AA313_de0209367 [Arthrobotrys entomopaga]